MLHNYLRGAISDLHSLIELTRLDIADISLANHQSIFSRNDDKQLLIKAFESKKNLIEQEMVSLKNNFPEKSLSDLVDEEADQLISSMKENLRNLQKLNANYARTVLAVSEFFSSLVAKIIPHEACDYKGNRAPQSNFLKIRA